MMRLGCEVRTGEHPFLPLKALYVDDPDGYHIELTVPFEDQEEGRQRERRHAEDAEDPEPHQRAWHGRR
jgi:hypothetical protein